MSKRTTEQFDKKFFMDEPLYDYMVTHSVRPLSILNELRQETMILRGKHMISPPEQVQFMQFLMKMLQPKNILEIGVFTGYSTLAMALSAGNEAQITGLELNDQWQELNQKFWKKAGVNNQINMIYGDGLTSLEAMSQNETYDFIFLDADKERYLEYYEACIPLLRKGGILMADNVFTWGLVADETKSKRIVQKMRLFNKHVHQDSRVDITMIPMADGFTLVRKR